MEINKEIELAWDFVNKSQRNIFLTGKAGTGKTTFLHTLKQNSLKRMVIVAPTGVAAINAKEYDQAIKYYEKSLSMEPDNFISLSNLGVAFVQKGNLISINGM